MPSKVIRSGNLWTSKHMSQVQKDAVVETLAETLPDIQADAKMLAPEQSGTLMRSIKTRIDRIRLGGAIYTEVPYSHLVEFGTKFMRARPYMRPALDRNRKKILRTLRRELSRQWRRP
jgi:HK97 gp10 family phage protein